MRRFILILAVVSGSLFLATSPVAADTTPGDASPIVVTMTLDSIGSIDRAGNVTVSGTITCDVPANGYVEGQIRQVVGRLHTLRGWFWAATSCSPQPARWSGSAKADEGKFAGSSAEVDAYATAYAEGEPPGLGFAQESGSIRLRR